MTALPIADSRFTWNSIQHSAFSVSYRSAVVGGGAVRPASRSFQFRIVLKPRKKFPCVCQRQNGRFANITTCPLPIGASMATARPAIASPPTSRPDSSRSFGSVGNDRSTRGALGFAPPPPRPPRPCPAVAPGSSGAEADAGAAPPPPPPPVPRPPRPPRPWPGAPAAAATDAATADREDRPLVEVHRERVLV